MAGQERRLKELPLYFKWDSIEVKNGTKILHHAYT